MGAVASELTTFAEDNVGEVGDPRHVGSFTPLVDIRSLRLQDSFGEADQRHNN